MEKKSEIKERFEKASEEEFDDIMGICVICDKKGLTKLEHKSLCAKHLVMLEDEGCMKAYLQRDIEEYGKIKEHKGIQSEIKKQMPKLYKDMKDFFSV